MHSMFYFYVVCVCEQFNIYFIGASTADFSDTRWRVLHLWERKDSISGDKKVTCYNFVGFMTLFLFTNPLRVLRPTSLRICQALVLPPYQRQGHGASLMKLAYSLGKDMEVFDITVEDPADGFTALRDALDLKVRIYMDSFSTTDCSTIGTK